MKATVIGSALPNLPWQSRPANCHDVIWRYAANPIITRDAIRERRHAR